ncbi:MAG TPA: 4'-phosphopantetheinyl transferase superfamily protein [Candidatus Fraserbacteria bacterium]|nr:4'-phosphopantetheinyl transferase superfamily protein [Candidatus Fraserbacteria bacterium]
MYSITQSARRQDRSGRCCRQLCAPGEVQALQSSGREGHWLAGEELAQLARLRSPWRRRDWLAGRLAAKRLIRRYLAHELRLSLALSQILIGYEALGQPRASLASPAGERWPQAADLLKELSLSLAHSEGWGLAALSGAGEIGVDLQRVRPLRVGLAQRILSPSERARLAERFSCREPAALLLYWTLKEAALKALGFGLRLPMRAVQVELARQSGRARLRIELPGGPRYAVAAYRSEPPGFQAAVVRLQDEPS